MTNHDRVIIDTIDTAEYMTGELSDEEIEVPPHMIPPNPDETDILPSQVHPSYPYGNPTSLKHPASRPRWHYDPLSRALFEDMGFGGGGINGALRWRELGLDDLLPVDEEKEAAERAIQARKMASGVTSNNPQTHQQPAGTQGQWDEEDDDEEGDDDDDENDDTDNVEDEEDEEDDLDAGITSVEEEEDEEGFEDEEE